jgi:cystathionine gamma-synthase
MRGYGGLITFLVKDADWKQTAAVVDAAKVARIAPSLGGVESLIEQPLIMSYYETPPSDRKRYGIPDNMIRLACGIENSADLIADLAQALEKGSTGLVQSSKFKVQGSTVGMQE